MRILKSSMLLSALVLTAACGNDDKQADRAAYDDMMLPRPAAQQVISAEELGLGDPSTVATPLVATPEVKPVAAARTTRAPARRSTSTARRSSSSSSSSGTYTPAREPRMVTKKNTKRDAAIGAAAGAVIGGVATGKVKGAVIGGVLGGVAGAVIGNNVDVKKVPQY